MNFIYTIYLFAMFTAGFVVGGNNSTGDVHGAFVVLSIISSILAGLTLIVGFFANLDNQEDMKRYLSDVRMTKASIKLSDDLLSQYRDDIQSFITNLYPDYEKELFNKMSPGDVQGLHAFLVKYPELKFNGVLEKYIAQLTVFMNQSFSYKHELNNIYARIYRLSNSSWFLLKANIPADILKAVTEL
jgi:hypothetical protein